VVTLPEDNELYRGKPDTPDDVQIEPTEDDALLSTTVGEQDSGQRLDAWLARQYPRFSRSHWQRLIAAGLVQVEGAPGVAKASVWAGQAIEAVLELPAAETTFAPENLNLDVRYEDAQIAIINKRAGIVVHPAAGNWSGTLLNGILHHWPAAAALPRAGIVHRLDKDTSGLLVIAKDAAAQWSLVKQLQAKSVDRTYLALVRGRMVGSGRVDVPIGRDPRNRTRMGVVGGGKEAATRYTVLANGVLDTGEKNGVNVSLLRCELETGRTHQIRVHLSHLAYPLVGDAIYGGARVMIGGFTRQALHAAHLALVHPSTQKTLAWSAELPDDFVALLKAARIPVPSAADVLA
jgi:23S rRNA pseudouridine1911/1915/1917 synthase